MGHPTGTAERYPLPEYFRRVLYIAAPVHSFTTEHHNRALISIKRFFRGSTIMPARDMFSDTQDWKRRWPELRHTFDGAVVVPDADGWIGAGVLYEVIDLLNLGKPVWCLNGDPDALFTVTSADERLVKTRTMPFVPWPVVDVVVHVHDPHRIARLTIPEPDVLLERLPPVVSHGARWLAGKTGVDLRRFPRSLPHNFIGSWHVMMYLQSLWHFPIRYASSPDALVPATWRARVLARVLGIDLRHVTGSGTDGTVGLNDIEAFARDAGIVRRLQELDRDRAPAGSGELDGAAGGDDGCDTCGGA